MAIVFYLFKQKFKNMKKLKFVSGLLVLAIITVFSSCKKEVAQSENSTQAVAMSSNISSDAAVGSGTQFGVGLEGSDNEKMTIANKMGVKYIRMMVQIKNYSGGGMTSEKSLTQKGYKVVLNINWDGPTHKGDNKIGAPFPTDMNKYRQQLTKLLQNFKPEIAVIENEPTVDLFHSGPITNYINELKTAVSVCKQFNVKVADGATHVPLIASVMNGNAGGKAGDVKKLITAYKSIDLDYVNVHTQGPTGKDPDVYQAGLLKKVADYMRNQTGKPIMSNEFTVHDKSSDLVKSMVSGFKDGNYVVAMVRSAYSPNGAVPLHQGSNLLQNGVTYSNVIK
jgi:hypothetical protein